MQVQPMKHRNSELFEIMMVIQVPLNVGWRHTREKKIVNEIQPNVNRSLCSFI